MDKILLHSILNDKKALNRFIVSIPEDKEDTAIDYIRCSLLLKKTPFLERFLAWYNTGKGEMGIKKAITKAVDDYVDNKYKDDPIYQAWKVKTSSL